MKKRLFTPKRRNYYGYIILILLTIHIFGIRSSVTYTLKQTIDSLPHPFNTHIKNPNPIIENLTVHGPILITTEQNFTDYGFPGLGTNDDPYCIEGLNISTTKETAIEIRDITKYFVIQNCLISANRYGIRIENATSGDYSNLNFSRIVTVKDNLFFNNWDGLFIYECWNASITNNVCLNNDRYGIRLEYSLFLSVKNNTSYNNQIGICLFESSASIVQNNFCFDCESIGLIIWSSSDSIVSNNTCVFNGRGGIEILSGFPVIKENICANNGETGISTLGASSSTIFNNSCFDNKYGIYNKDSFWANITMNSCFENEYGIFLTRGSWYDTIEKNKCYNNSINGIHIESAKESTVSYNQLNSNTEYGIFCNNETIDTIIAYNSLKENNVGGFSQAWDEGEGNIWYDQQTKMGNYWSDWASKWSYEIEGQARSRDRYLLDENLERLLKNRDLYLILLGISIGIIMTIPSSYLIIKKLKKTKE
ncbi:MAG: NosD domain-containing protein [Candidatus Heimdallarchaeaceae archaeon]